MEAVAGGAGAVEVAAAVVVAGEAAVAMEVAAGMAVVVVANKSPVEQHARARERDILRPFLWPSFHLHPRYTRLIF